MSSQQVGSLMLMGWIGILGIFAAPFWEDLKRWQRVLVIIWIVLWSFPPLARLYVAGVL